MTRINLVHPQNLSNNHLMAEYHELPRIFTLVSQAISKCTYHTKQIPPKFKLGAGHVTFFYNKLPWLLDHYTLIKNELDSKGYKLNQQQYEDIVKDAEQLIDQNKNLWIDWTPDYDDLYLSVERLKERGWS